MRGAGVLGLGMVVACSAPHPSRRLSEAMERSARMLRQLDALEADLHQGAAETDTYAELVARHGQAEQMACKVTDEHVAEISRLQAVQEARMAGKRQDRVKKRKVVALAHPRAAARRAVASN